MLVSLKRLLVKRSAHLHSAGKGALLVIQEHWPNLASAYALPPTVRPFAFRRGRLVLLCTSLLEAREISLRKGEIIQEVNKALQKEGVAQVRDVDFEVRI